MSRGAGPRLLGLLCLALAAGCTAPRPAPQEALPPLAGPTFDLALSSDHQWAEGRTRELVERSYRALRGVYQADPPLSWRLEYASIRPPAWHDLPLAPTYSGEGLVRLPVDYLRTPDREEEAQFTDLLGTLEGLAYGFNRHFGLQYTDLDAGVAAIVSRQAAPQVWGGMRMGEIHAAILGFQEVEEEALRVWREQGRAPDGMTPEAFERVRQVALCREISQAGPPDTWAALFRAMEHRGRPLNTIGDRRAGNRMLVRMLRGATGMNLGSLLDKYGYER